IIQTKMDLPLIILTSNLFLNLVIYYFHPIRQSGWAPKPLEWSGPKVNLVGILFFLILIIPFVVFFFILNWLEKARIKEVEENERIEAFRKNQMEKHKTGNKKRRR